MNKANSVFHTLCNHMDALGLHYTKDESDLTAVCPFRGEDLPIELRIGVDADKELVMVLSFLPFTVAEDKRLELAIAISIANNKLVDGCFDYDIQGGHIFFRQVASYMDSDLGAELFSYMMECSHRTIDDFNDKFMLLSKGIITLEKYMEMVM